jgi:hypothetical protein
MDELRNCYSNYFPGSRLRASSIPKQRCPIMMAVIGSTASCYYRHFPEPYFTRTSIRPRRVTALQEHYASLKSSFHMPAAQLAEHREMLTLRFVAGTLDELHICAETHAPWP